MHISDLVSHRAVMYFFKQQQFENYTLAVPCGNRVHECCMFFRQSDTKLDAILFNSNFSVHTQGVQYNKVSACFLEKFGKRHLNKINSYFIDSCNVEGNCVGYVWRQIFNLLCKDVSPFTSSDILLTPYNRFMTETSYKAKMGEFEQFWIRLWLELDLMFADKTEVEISNISVDLIHILSKFA